MPYVYISLSYVGRYFYLKPHILALVGTSETTKLVGIYSMRLVSYQLQTENSSLVIILKTSKLSTTRPIMLRFKFSMQLPSFINFQFYYNQMEFRVRKYINGTNTKSSCQSVLLAYSITISRQQHRM